MAEDESFLAQSTKKVGPRELENTGVTEPPVPWSSGSKWGLHTWPKCKPHSLGLGQTLSNENWPGRDVGSKVSQKKVLGFAGRRTKRLEIFKGTGVRSGLFKSSSVGIAI